MKKSIPISDDLTEYFTNPCPALSDNNSRLILAEIDKGYDYLVEYGMGSSTLYFLQATEKHKTALVSVENNIDWFDICVRETKRQTRFQETSYFRHPWTLLNISDFIKGGRNTDIPEKLKRFSRWKNNLSLGPFIRFSPDSKGRFGGKLGPLWSILRPAFRVLTMIIFMLIPSRRPQNAEWVGINGQAKLILRNVGPSIKDQYGEAPNMMDYINAGLKDIKSDITNGKNVSAIFVIDGGPRHKIVQEILMLENRHKNFKPTIFLCDASRIFYHPTLEQRPSGRFIAGTGSTLKGGPVANDVSGDMALFWTGGDKTAPELAQQEVWFYKAN